VAGSSEASAVGEAGGLLEREDRDREQVGEGCVTPAAPTTDGVSFSSIDTNLIPSPARSDPGSNALRVRVGS